MRMKKLLTNVCMLAMVAVLGACGGGQTPAENHGGNEAVVTEQPEQKEPTEGVDSEKEEDSSNKPEDVKEPEGNVDAENLPVLEKSVEDDVEALEALVEKDVEDTIVALEAESEQWMGTVDTYDKYVENASEIESYYKKIYEESKELCFRLYEYTYEYADMVLKSDLSCYDMYDTLEIIYNSIYDDAGDEIYDGIYDGILDDMYEAFYEEIFDAAYDTVPYSELSKNRSQEYKWLSGTRSDVYSALSDCRSDVYEFYCDIRGELWGDDIKKAEKELEKFREDIDKLKKKASDKEEKKTSENVQNPSPTAEPKEDVDDTREENKQEENKQAASIRPEFKAALDSYEEFFDEYCNFMKKYKENPTDFGLLTEYAEFLTKYTEAMKKMSALNDGSLNEEELKYYLQVTNRINEKLLDAAL